MLDFGVKRGDHVGVISDNRREWIIANLGILGLGAADVPRGADTMPAEACYILQHADVRDLPSRRTPSRPGRSSPAGAELPLLKALIVIDERVPPGEP